MLILWTPMGLAGPDPADRANVAGTAWGQGGDYGRVANYLDARNRLGGEFGHGGRGEPAAWIPVRAVNATVNDKRNCAARRFVVGPADQ